MSVSGWELTKESIFERKCWELTLRSVLKWKLTLRSVLKVKLTLRSVSKVKLTLRSVSKGN